MSGSRVVGHVALAVETSTASGGVALGREDEILGTARLDRKRAHASELLPAIEQLCQVHGVSPRAITEAYVSAGPGSFTGLRIGITVTKSLALATGARVVAVPTLEVIAQNAADVTPPPERVVVVLDAKRGHVYTAAFAWNGGSYRPLSEPEEAEPAAFIRGQPADCAVLGEGVLYHQAAVEAAGRGLLPGALYPPRPQTVYRLGLARARRGEFCPPRLLVPIYVRPPEAEEMWQRRHAGGV